MDSTHARPWAGFMDVAVVLNLFTQRNTAPSKAVQLVDVPLRMTRWQRNHEGHPKERDPLIRHTDSFEGRPPVSVRWSVAVIEVLRSGVGRRHVR